MVKVNLMGTLKGMKVGQVIELTFEQARGTTLRNTASILKELGNGKFNINKTEAGFKVTRYE